MVVVSGFRPLARQEAVEAKQFILTDRNDKLQAKLSVNDGGFPTLVFYDDKGRTRLKLGLTDAGTGLEMFDGAERSLFSARADLLGTTQLEMAQPNGKRVSFLSMKEGNGSAEFCVGDVDGPDELAIGVLDGQAYVRLGRGIQGAKAVAGLMLGSGPDGTSHFAMTAKDVKEQLLITSDADGRILIDLIDSFKKKLVPDPSTKVIYPVSLLRDSPGSA